MGGTSIFSLLGTLAIDGVDESKKALDDVSKSGKEAKDKLNVSFKEIATKAGEMGKTMAVGLAGVATAAIAAVEGTKEFRQDLGKLETSFSLLAEGGAKQGTQTFKELYAVLGEDDTAIEAANNLVALTGNTQDLGEWTNILTGVYATFGDSLPIEGLAEAANETARTGLLTGGLTDAINWASLSGETFGVTLKKNTKANEEWNKKVKEATTAEEFFQLALEDCANASEREKLIRETLNGIYGESAAVYKETNESVMANNTAQADLNLKMAEMAEKIEPIITKGKVLLADVLTKLEPVIDWLIENLDWLAPVILGVATALTVFSTVMGVVNAVMLASPVTWIVLAIVAALAALIAIIVLVVKNWDKIKEATSNAIDKIKEVCGNIADWFKTYVIDPIINFFVGLWEGLKAIWNGIVNAIKFAFDLIVTAITTYIQLITLPFRFIWENCKELVFKAFEWIKEKIGIAIDFIKGIVQKGFDLIRKYIVDPVIKAKDWVVNTFQLIKDKISEKINQVKAFIQTAFNFIKEKIINPIIDAKNKVVDTVGNIKDKVVETFNNIKSKVTDIFNKVKTAITTPIEKAKEIIKGIVDKIKGFFKFNIEFPKIKLPHFSVKPKGWKIGDLLEGSVPKLGIDWYAKAVKAPMLLEKPTAFGISPSGNLRVGGEAGSEMVGGTSTIMNMIGNAVSSNNGGIEDKLDKLIYLFSNLNEAMRNQQVVLSTGELVGALTSPLDKSLGELAEGKRRGR